MLKTIKNTLAATFCLCAVAGAAKAEECRSETSKPMDIIEFGQPLPANQALGMIILFDPGSELFSQINKALPDQYGEILNGVTSDVMKFDPHSARKLNDKTFNEMPIVLLHGCLQKRGLITDAITDLQKIPGIKAVTFDVKLYEPINPPKPAGP